MKAKKFYAGALGLALLAGCSGDVGNEPPALGPGGVPPGQNPPPPVGSDMPLPGGPAPAIDDAEAAAVESDLGVQLNGTPLYARLVRLTHEQWANTLSDLLPLDTFGEMARRLTTDPLSGLFPNNEQALFVTPGLRLDYRTAAESIAEQLTTDPTLLSSLLSKYGQDAESFIQNFGKLAYRRPVAPEEQARLAALYARGNELLGGTDPTATGTQLVLEAMLQSPNFLYRSEMSAPGTPLSDYELAAKLALQLTQRGPDAELLAAADQGMLSTPEGYRAQAQRLLGSDSARQNLLSYHSYLIGLSRYDTIEKAETVFPEFSEELRASMIMEAETYLDAAYERNWTLTDLLTSRTGFVNEQTASLYGVQASGAELQEVSLPEDRAGFFTRVGFLSYNASMRDPDPIHRGVDINDRFLCSPIPAPPANVPALPDFEPGQTNRQRVDAHSGPGTCGAGCHAVFINPVGFAFENYDAIGRWRDIDNGQEIDASGSYPFATGALEFNGAANLMQVMSTSRQVHACYASHMLQYVLGRDVATRDAFSVAAVEAASSAGSSVNDLLLSVVESDAFRVRQGQ